MAKQITRLTQDEINFAKSSMGLQDSTLSYSKNEPEVDYIEKLTDDEIIKYFNQFGFKHLKRTKKDFDSLSTIQVTCDDLFLAMSNYDIFINIFNSPSSHSKFDMNAFVDYCNTVDIAPDKALGELIQMQLLGQRFHSYEKNFAKHKQAERKHAFEGLSKDMQKMVSIINDKRENEITSIQNKLKYGDFQSQQQTNI